jgi:pimeloyl-ACP methyl ester carboxylesterase
MIEVREYGTSGPRVLLLHGGPGAPGHMAPIGRDLASEFRVFEPFQRHSGGPPLTVARHVDDLHEVIESLEGREPTHLVGSSWGAMLALAYAARHPDRVGRVTLVGCGTFDPLARQRFEATLRERMGSDLSARLRRLEAEVEDPDERLRIKADVLLPLYSYRPITTEMENERVDARGHRETWEDMLRLQADGVYPAAFNHIVGPVLMLHGEHDPHPGRMIRASLAPHIPQLEYHEWERCGHYPWLEGAVRRDFFSLLTRWLSSEK